MSAMQPAATVTQLRPKLDSVLTAIEEAQRIAAQAMRRIVELRVAATASFAEREVAYLQVSNDLCRTNIKHELEAIVASHEEELLVDGEHYRKHQKGTVPYHSLCGTMKICRPTYRLVGEHNGPTVVPLDLQAGIMHHATPALAFALASGYAEGPDRQCDEQLRAAQREPPSRSTIERIAKAIGTQAKGAARRIEPILRAEEKLPKGAHAMSVGLDRTTVPMEEPRPDGAPLPTGRKKRTKPYVRSVPPRIDVNYRMAYVGTVSVVDEHGECLVARRYAASAEDGPDTILRRMMADVRWAREAKSDLPIGIVQDGSPEMWNLVRSALQEHVGIQASHEAVDRYHFNERIASVLRIVEVLPEQRTHEVERWKEAFDKDDEAIDAFAGYLNEKLFQYADHKDLATLQENWTFISNNNDRLRYASLLLAGLPEGSGTTEGACKSLVSMRAKRSGQRWHTDGVEAVLALRSIKMSDRLPSFWAHFADDYTAEIRAAV